MDKPREYELTHRRTVEKMIEDFEENEAKYKEESNAIHLRSKSHGTRIGPANDLLRFLYILEEQCQNDNHEDRKKAREDLLEYLDQNRPYEDSTDDNNSQDEGSESNGQIEQSNPPSTATNSFTPSHTAPTPPTQLSLSASGPTQPSPIEQQSLPIAPVTIPTPKPSPAKQQSLSIAPVTDPSHIQSKTLQKYEKLVSQARQYDQRYSSIQPTRKSQFRARLKGILNKIREDTFDTLYKELLDFLSGHNPAVSSQTIGVENEEERLLCLSMLAMLIFDQLLGSDLNDGKANTLLPLVGALSADPKNKEFSVIFLDRLFKKCPYTVPYYPKREATMDDTQYLEALGYIQIQDGEQRRLETESEFLNRMCGLIRLFCKLLVRRGPPFDVNASYAWAWLADICNLPPQPNITAVLLRVFLDEAGQMMVEVYPTQFLSLTKAIRMQFLSQLENGTGDSELSRLRLTLDKILGRLK